MAIYIYIYIYGFWVIYGSIGRFDAWNVFVCIFEDFQNMRLKFEIVICWTYICDFSQVSSILGSPPSTLWSMSLPQALFFLKKHARGFLGACILWSLSIYGVLSGWGHAGTIARWGASVCMHILCMMYSCTWLHKLNPNKANAFQKTFLRLKSQKPTVSPATRKRTM